MSEHDHSGGSGANGSAKIDVRIDQLLRSTHLAGRMPGPKRFHGTVILDATRVGRDAGRIADEVISHLSGLVGTKVTHDLRTSNAMLSAIFPRGVTA